MELSTATAIAMHGQVSPRILILKACYEVNSMKRCPKKNAQTAKIHPSTPVLQVSCNRILIISAAIS